MAFLLCVCFIVWMFIFDLRRRSATSRALWIPLIWTMICGSRPVVFWLSGGAVLRSEIDIISGNPIDRAIFGALILGGLLILLRRKIGFSATLKNNMWIMLLVVYCGFSVLWSEFPYVAFKRWTREVGNFVMVLVVLTEADPNEAIKSLFRRCAYVLVPLSVVLIRYYPHLSRVYSPWTGEVEFIGVATSKNMLGNLCLVFGLFFLWNILMFWRKKDASVKKRELYVSVAFMPLILWLLIKSDSVTSLVCFILGGCILLVSGFSIVKRNVRLIGFFVLVGIISFMMVEWLFDLGQVLIENLGRDMTLTGRTDLWNVVVDMVSNPLIGAGYESFWLGDRLKAIWAIFWWHPAQAHNGYLEVYLNLGLIGLSLLAGVILASYRNIQNALRSDFDYGRLRIAFFGATLVVNATESLFKGASIVWLVFVLMSMNVPRKREMAGSQTGS